MTPIRWSDRISGLQIRYESGTVHESHFFLARPCNSVFCGQLTVLQLTHTHTHTKRILDLKIEDNVLVSVSSGPSRSIGPLGHHPRRVRPSHRPVFIFGVVCIRCNECRMGAWGGTRRPLQPRRRKRRNLTPRRSPVPSPGLRGLLRQGWVGVRGHWARSFRSTVAPAGTGLNL